MKLPILLTAFIIIATTMHAQNSRTDTYRYQKGGDSVRFVILAATSDTIQTTEYYRSGKVSKIKFGRDSTQFYNALGQLYETEFGNNPDVYNKKNYVKFYPNGRPLIAITNDKRGRTVKKFAKDGRLLLSDVTRFTDSSAIYRVEDRNGVPILVGRRDTFEKGEKPRGRISDTSFYDNGRPAIIRCNGLKDEIYGRKGYHRDGTLAYTMLADSLGLMTFKDNINCYYGLKNRRGDTIVTPIYEEIIRFNDFWVATYGDDLLLFNLDGSKITTAFKHLTSITGLYQTTPEFSFSEGIENIDLERRRYETFFQPNYYTFQEDGKWGIMDGDGKVVMPPQYFNVAPPNLLFPASVDNGNFFNILEQKDDTLSRSTYVNRQGKLVFEEKYKTTIYTGYENYFYLTLNPYYATTPEYLGDPPTNKTRALGTWYFQNAPYDIIGLGKGDGTVLIEPRFTSIQHFMYAPLFITLHQKKINKDKTEEWRHGIFNVQSRRWLLDTLDYKIHNRLNEKPQYFVVEHVPSHKWGIMDTTGKYIVPVSLDFIELVDDKAGVFKVKKEKNFHVLKIEKGLPRLHTTKYDTLALIRFNERIEFLDEPISYFFAKQKGKWGLIDVNEKRILPFEFDYVSKSTGNYNDFFMVKNNQVAFFDLYSLPNQLPIDHNFADNRTNKTTQMYYQLVNQDDHVFFYNESGRVVIPPQYKLVKEALFVKDYAFVEDDKKQKKLFFMSTGQAIDFPFNYEVVEADAKSRVIVVKDTAEVSYGVVSTDGKLLVPCNNYNVIVSDNKTSVFFVKREKPIIVRHDYSEDEIFRKELEGDTLTKEDADWLMYDGHGKLLNNKPFRFPINFVEGIGIGMQDDVSNLFRTDGSIFAPFERNTEGGKDSITDIWVTVNGYKNIHRDPQLSYYSLFTNQGLTSSLLLTTKKGEVLGKYGRYDGISKFYDKYALVTAAGKVGLIDSLGREVIAPQDLRTYTGQFIDSLDLVNEKIRQTVKNYEKDYSIRWLPQPIDFAKTIKNISDSSTLSKTQRATFINLSLEENRDKIIATSSDFLIPRVDLKENATSSSQRTNNLKKFTVECINTTTTDSICSFISNIHGYTFKRERSFYNYYLNYGTWKALILNDLLNIQGDKRIQINNLLIQKIKLLKDAQIDCSNPSAFINQVENKWQGTREGINLYFDASNTINTEVIISFTWAELSPFLKLKIY
jgi:hypothetical protein